MLKFLKLGIEFNNLAKAMNGMNIMIQDLQPKINRSFNKSEFEDDVIGLAYIARKGVFDRLEEYNWPITSKISVPTIDRGRITLTYALMQTVGKVSMIAEELDIADDVQEILDKGPLFYKVEKTIPQHLLKNI